MSLSAYALCSVAELKSHVGAEGSSEDARLEDAINRASAWIESQTRRKLITRGDATEFHTVRPGTGTIQTAEWPLISITSIHESTASPRVYDATTLLVADTDYQHVAVSGMIHRLSSSELAPWAAGRRAIKVIYAYGYASIATVPDDLKHLCLFVAASMYKESDRKRWGQSSITDAQGSVTRFLGYLPPDMKDHLSLYSRPIVGSGTWEAA